MSAKAKNGRHATTVRLSAPVTTVLLVRRSRELARHLPSAISGDDTGVHQARVASRRLREAVPVLTAGLKRSKKAERKIRRVTRALGTVREMDVTMQILDELARSREIPRNALEDVRAHVIAERDRRREVMHDRLRKVNTPKLSRRLTEVAVELGASTDEAWKATLIKRISQRAKRLSQAIHEAGKLYSPDPLHQVRIAVKKLRYTLELAADAHVTSARPLVASLKRAQETLGRLNDLHVIQRHVAEVQARPPARKGSADGGLEVINASLERDCRFLHARYLAQVSVLLDVVEQARSSIVDQLTAVEQKRPVLRMASAKAPRLVARRA